MTTATHASGPIRRPWLGPLVVFGLSCLVFWLSSRAISQPPAWRTFEFCQYAEIGRNLAVEGRYDTRLVEPMALAMLDRAGVKGDRWPVVNRYPLPCVVVAGLMKGFGATDRAAAWSNGLALGLLAATCYAVARRWYGAGWASVATGLFLLNPSFYGEFPFLGTPDVWFAALFVLELVTWSRWEGSIGGRARLGWAVGLGVLGGLAYLTRFNATLFLGVQAGALLARRRWREALAFGLMAAAVASPIFVYNWARVGKPVDSLYSAWNLLDRIGAYRVEPWLYYRVPDLWGELASHSGGVARKFADNLFGVVPRGLPRLWRLETLWPLLLVAPWLAGRATPQRRFAGWALGLFGLQLVVFSALRLEVETTPPVSPHNGRYFFWFAGPAVVLGVSALARLAAWRPAGRGLAVGLVAIQLGLFGWAWWLILPWHLRSDSNIGTDPIRRMLAEVVGPGRVIASNQPQVTAWFGGLRSISLPADPDELARLNRDSPTSADYLFVDMNYNCIDLDRNWKLLTATGPALRSPWEDRLLADYQYVLPPHLTRPIRYVFLRRRAVPAGPLEIEIRRDSRDPPARFRGPRG